MNSRKKPDASRESESTEHGSLGRRLSAIFPLSITKWFSNKSSSPPPNPANVMEPEPKRRRLSDGLSYAPSTTCASTNTESFCSVQNTSFQTSRSHQKRIREEDLVKSSEHESLFLPKNRVSYILKTSLHSGDTYLMKATGSDMTSSGNSSSAINGTSGSPFASTRSSLDISQPSGSTFYPGGTVYGGASNNWSNKSRHTLQKRNTSIAQSVENNDIQISGSSKRILNLLENYSSPLGEIRRISKFAMEAEKSPSSKYNSKMTQELQVPSIASLLSIKKKSNMMATTSTARRLLASQSSTTKFSPYPSVRSTSTTKKDETHEFSPLSELPDNVLKIPTDVLPNFSFTPSKLFSTMSQSVNNIERELLSPVDSMETLPANTSFFEFTKPVQTSDMQNNIMKNNSTVTMNEVVTATNITEDDAVLKSAQSGEISKEQSSDEKETRNNVSDTPKTQKPLTWKCAECWVQNDMSKSECVCCGAKSPSKQLDTNLTPVPAVTASSVSLLNNRNSPDPTLSVRNIDQGKSQEESWECQTCLLKNNKQDSKCICCQAAKSDSKESAKLSSLKAEEVKRKDQNEKWDCKVCLVKNEKHNSKCVCCEAEKPGAEMSATLSNKNAEVGKSNEEKWECSICLVRNDKNTSKCVCCEAEKPGAKKSELKFNFSLPTNTSFKFGIKPNDTKQAPPVKQVETEVKEKNNNVTPSGFSFGIPASKSDNTSLPNNVDKSKESTPTFTFGIPKESSTESKPTEFGQALPAVGGTKKDETKVKQQEVTNIETSDIAKPCVTFLPESLKTTFPTPASTSDILNKQITPNENTTKGSTFTTNTPEVQMSSPSVEPTVTAAQTAFNCSQPSNQPQSTISFAFNMPTSVNSTSSLFGNKDLPNTTSSPATPFQQSSASTVTAITTSTTPVTNSSSSFNKTFSNGSQPPSSTIFNFGSNNTGVTPMLNFSFGSNPITSTSNTGFGAVRKFDAPQTVPNLTNLSALTSGSSVTSGNSGTNAFDTNNSLTFTNTGTSLFSSTPGSVSSGGIFGSSTENRGWPVPNNVFSTPQTNASSITQRPTTFTFGSNNNSMTFGTNNTNVNMPLFPANNSIAQVFGVAPANNAQQSSFPTAASAFINQQSSTVNNTAQQDTAGPFGSPSTNTMGSFAGARPSFPEPSNPMPAFNFSAGQSSTGLFNFSQVHSGVTPHFQVGSSSSTGQTRRIRKAIRRTQR